MGKLFIILNLVIASLGQMAYSSQTIVFIRHGEKPDNDSGQLTCKGLNRSLALPDILINKYGIPQAIYAAAPKQNKLGHSLRALQTISPTAIRLSLPINLKYHAKETKELQRSLLNDKYADSVIFVAWEHDNLVKTAKAIMEQLGETLNKCLNGKVMILIVSMLFALREPVTMRPMLALCGNSKI